MNKMFDLKLFYAVHILILFFPLTADSQKDLVQPEETHLEGVPSFIEHPQPLYYTMKGHPATIQCVAEPVSHAAIKCADQTVPYKGPEEFGKLKVIFLDSNNQPDPNGKRWVLQMQVRARDVEEWFDAYICHCEAWNQVVELQRPKKVISQTTVVKEAYLEKKFQLEPVSTDLVVGKRLVLKCIPPKGKPDPEIYWLKDGKRIDSKTFAHIIINDYNHLIIENTTITDSGNYTCVASCLNIEYRYANARVNIFPYQSALNPPLDDKIKWTEWGSCHKTLNTDKSVCQQTRYRLCSTKLTSNDQLMFPTSTKLKTELQPDELTRALTANCPLPWFQTRNCSLEQCSQSRNLMNVILDNEKSNLHATTSQPSIFKTREIAIYVGLFLSLALLLGIVAIVALITRRKSLRFSTSHAIHYSTCFQTKRVCRQEKMNKISRDLLSSNDVHQNMITISNPSASDSRQTEPMLRLNQQNYSNNNGSNLIPNTMNGFMNRYQQQPLQPLPSKQQHQEVTPYSATPVHNIPLNNLTQGLMFSNGTPLVGSPKQLISNLPPTLPPPLPPSLPLPPNSLPPLPSSPLSLGGSKENSDVNSYMGFPSSVPSTQHFMNNIPPHMNANNNNNNNNTNNFNRTFGSENSRMDMEYGLSKLSTGQIYNPNSSSHPQVLIDSSSGPSPANTGTNTTQIGSGNGESSNGSIGLPITTGAINMITKNANAYSFGYMECESGDYNDENDDDDMGVRMEHHHQQQHQQNLHSHQPPPQQHSSRPPSALYHELSLDQDSVGNGIMSEYKETLDIDTIIHGTISNAGGQLSLNESGVFLTIPQGALQSTTIGDIYLAICREDKHRPKLGDHQTLLSPVIQFGPMDLRFSTPVLLSFPHCAALNQGSWLIRILALGPGLNHTSNYLTTNPNTFRTNRNSHEFDNSNWQEVGIIGYETNLNNITCHLDNNMAHLMTDIAQRYCLVGETQKQFFNNHLIGKSSSQNEFNEFNYNTNNNNTNNNINYYRPKFNNQMTDSSQDSGFLSDLQLAATKILKLAAFAGPIKPTIDYNIRVYVLTDTKDALEHVINVEYHMEGKLLDDPKSLLFKDNGGGLCFLIEDISTGWRSRLQNKSQEIPFRHIWNGTQMSTLHCAFSLEHVDPRQLVVSCRIIVYQENAQLQGQVLQICSQKYELPSMNGNSKSNYTKNIYPNPHDGVPENLYSTISYKLSVSTSQRICKLLDGRENDWHKLAKHLGMERYISYLKFQPSPTMILLNLWEARNRDGPTLNELKSLFYAIDRMDCANILENDTLQTWQS